MHKKDHPMPRLALKPDSSFFREIAHGAFGGRAVCKDLDQKGHAMAELERGATDTKMWKDVKRKRVRIPDLICTRCGLRVESKTKTKPDLAMSQSTENSRAWDSGMVDADLIAFPVCIPSKEAYWSRGKLGNKTSYWHEKNWVEWQLEGAVNYFSRRALRTVPFVNRPRKGVTEGAEAIIAWPAVFAKADATIVEVQATRIVTRRIADDRQSFRRIGDKQRVAVVASQGVAVNQILASAVRPTVGAALSCPGHLADGHVATLLASREKTQRFTGVKLARLRRDATYRDTARTLAADAEEDIYVRLEAVAYLNSVCGRGLQPLIQPYLDDPDPQNKLEAVITLAEAGTQEAVTLLTAILDGADLPYFLRSAAAWGLGQIGTAEAVERLVCAFSDVTPEIREEALDGIVSLNGAAIPRLLSYLSNDNMAIASGAAEAVRQCDGLTDEHVNQIAQHAKGQNPPIWPVWLLGNLPRSRVNAAIANLQDSAHELHYALSVLWSFCESWIARQWDLNPNAHFPVDATTHVAEVEEAE
jgi:HEAT repeat protein